MQLKLEPSSCGSVPSKGELNEQGVKRVDARVEACIRGRRLARWVESGPAEGSDVPQHAPAFSLIGLAYHYDAPEWVKRLAWERAQQEQNALEARAARAIEDKQDEVSHFAQQVLMDAPSYHGVAVAAAARAGQTALVGRLLAHMKRPLQLGMERADAAALGDIRLPSASRHAHPKPAALAWRAAGHTRKAHELKYGAARQDGAAHAA